MTSRAASTLPRPMICMVTDRRRYGDVGEDTATQWLVTGAGRAGRAGVDVVHVRERGMPDRRLLDLVRQVAEAAGPAVRVLVNGRTDVAIAAGAQGVHLPASAPPASRLREIVPGGFLIGRSVHALAEAVEAERAGGCDYLMFGAVYPTISKPDRAPAGLEALEAVCDAVRLPVVAIGGIIPEHARAVARAGAAGIAAIGMFVAAARGADPDREIAAAVARVRDAWQRV